MFKHLTKFTPLPILIANKCFCDYDMEKMKIYEFKLICGEEFKNDLWIMNQLKLLVIIQKILIIN